MAAVEAVDDGFHDCEECEEDEFFDAPEGSLASVTPDLSGSEASGECSVDHMHLQRNHVSDTREIDIDVACGTESAGLALPGVTRDSEPAEAPRRSSDDWHQTANSEQHREGVEGRANGRDQYIGVEPGCACNGGDEEEGDGEEAGEEELGTSGRDSGIESETATGKDWQQAKGMESVDAEGEVVFPDEEGEVVLSDEEGEVWGRKDDEEEAAAAAAEEEEEEEEGPQLTEEERKEMVEAAEALKKEGNQLFAAGEFEAAMEKYGEALAAAPVDAKETAVDDSYMKARLRRMLAYDRMDDPERALQDAKKARLRAQVLEQEPMNRDALQTAARLGPIVQERQEKMKAEMMGKLKDLGNTVLGKFGLSLDNFKVNQDPKTGGYSINFQQ